MSTIYHGDPVRPLTQRMLQIVQASANGKIYREMADDWGLKENTVKSMAWIIFQRLGADNMNQAIAMCLRRGLIE